MSEIDLYGDATAMAGATQDQAAEVALQVAKALALKDEIEAIEKTLKARSEELRTLLQRDLPEAMDVLGVSQLVAKDGRKVKVAQVCRAAIPAAKLPEAVEWLVAGGNGDLLKTQITAALGRGQHTAVQEAVKQLANLGIAAEVKETVHPSTLSAWVREQYEQGKGDALPADLLGIYNAREAKIS